MMIVGWPQLLVLGVGATIGAGIFVVTGVVAHDKTGPALFLSYIFFTFFFSLIHLYPSLSITL